MLKDFHLLQANVPLYPGLEVSVAAGWNLMSGPSGSLLVVWAYFPSAR